MKFTCLFDCICSPLILFLFADHRSIDTSTSTKKFDALIALFSKTNRQHLEQMSIW